jgi:hypothetical protein
MPIVKLLAQSTFFAFAVTYNGYADGWETGGANEQAYSIPA